MKVCHIYCDILKDFNNIQSTYFGMNAFAFHLSEVTVMELCKAKILYYELVKL
jgi:hypothetical protein